MSDYLITGKKGAGKSVFAVATIRDALRKGRRVATNLDIHLDKMFSPGNRSRYIRLPDCPTIEDFEALGRGQDGVIEDDNGVVVLDEVSKFLNARAWNEKGRKSLLDWFIHSRKLGWDVYYIAQGASQLDAQLRSTQMEYQIAVRSTGKWPVPFISPVLRFLAGVELHMPRGHLGVITQGIGQSALVIGRRWHHGGDLYACYDTQQVFVDRDHLAAVGLHSRLSAYDIKGRYLGWWPMNKGALFGGMFSGLILGVVLGAGAGYSLGKFPEHKAPMFQESQVDHSVAVVGVMEEGLMSRVLLADGTSMLADGVNFDSKGVLYRLGPGRWVRGPK